MAQMQYEGGCHCGAVRFSFRADLEKGASRCNCSICQKLGQTGTIGKPQDFELTKGDRDLGTYAWGARISTRYFCKTCGVYMFGKGYLKEIGGEYVSVNVNTLDGVDPGQLKIGYWDGRHNNWQAGMRDTPWPTA